MQQTFPACAGQCRAGSELRVIRCRLDSELSSPAYPRDEPGAPALRAEQELPLAPLPLEDAVALFRERARSVRPARSCAESEVAAICERLDRLPLAIELAAMHVKVLSLPELLERLTHRLALLREGARDLPARQQTMEDAIAWSYELLTDEQQRCFRALGVFVGGRTLEAAAAICWAEGEAETEYTIFS